MLERHFNSDKKLYTLYKGKKRLSRSKSKIKLYNKVIRCAHMLLKINHKKNHMNWYGMFVLDDKYKIMHKNIFLKCYKKEYQLKYIFNFIFPFSKYRVIIYKTQINYKDFETAPIHNKVVAIYKENDGFGFYKSIKWNFFKLNKTQYKSSGIKKLKETNTSIYVRQSSNNTLFITARIINETDNFIEQIKINFAYLISLIFPIKNVTIMFEKDANKYEESASVLYERLLDLNYKKIYYIIDKKSKHIGNIPIKYKKNIIYKGSFKGFLYFFYAKTFIGTEAPAHAISLRICNKYAEQKLHGKKYNYVFLQHGVMYMVSLASETRKSFRKGNLMPAHSKIVVSSKEEARHFIDDGEYEENDLYITGLPKFDRNYRYPTADKIIIMPTWRPWEYNQIRSDVKNTNYYKMLLEIVEGIPKELHDKVIVLPHPLFLEVVKDDFPIPLPTYTTYDELLRDCSVMITDYSSIAFDAYFRGSNVIFWWKEKKECMDNYKGHLMLNESNIYGPICNNKDELNIAIKKCYMKKQNEKELQNYNKIVQFHDFKNTDRLIEKLIKDKIIMEEK